MSGMEPQGRGRAERLGPLVITVLFSLPLWADPVAQALGYDVFYLADPKLQAVYATLVQLLGGWPLYARAVRGAAARRFGAAGLPVLASSLLYAGGLVAAVRNVPAILWFLAAGVALIVGHAVEIRGRRAVSEMRR
ncbi:hypothetical protein [Symbiobacterium thermophilum]|uniref:Uncharacterized protein n=2 Tax=Symbiobacterium thermophilum TaxID=2734 RepID=Q67LB2_SYMTH|nr:hypothetical protein [Symbiobacterium thermophilum]BAD41534.1 hypothetical protein STH2549 [Symbiobacterium thermophilum IAM 14863]